MILTRHGIECRKVHSSGDTIVIKLGPYYVAAVYWSPNEDVSGPLLDLEAAIRIEPRGRWIVGGDLNVGLTPIVSTSTLGWKKRQRSETAQVVIESLDLIIRNNYSPTSYHLGRDTTNDYTCTLNGEIEN